MTGRASFKHLKPGDRLAVKRNSPWGRDDPLVEHHILLVERLTATQAVTRYIDSDCEGMERVRLTDGMVIGTPYSYVVEATNEMLCTHLGQMSRLKRWRTATSKLSSLLDRPLRLLHLNLAQRERLAAAWEEVQAMSTKTGKPT